MAIRMKNDKLPIGYYLKKADNLLTEGINKILIELEIDRLKWQLLHSINQNRNNDKSEVVSILKEFAGEKVISAAIDDLIKRGLVVSANGTNLALSQKGEELHTRCLQRQKEFRQKATENVTQEEYIHTIETLEKIIGNLQ